MIYYKLGCSATNEFFHYDAPPAPESFEELAAKLKNYGDDACILEFNDGIPMRSIDKSTAERMIKLKQL
jgi:hypothetical protein